MKAIIYNMTHLFGCKKIQKIDIDFMSNHRFDNCVIVDVCVHYHTYQSNSDEIKFYGKSCHFHSIIMT